MYFGKKTTISHQISLNGKTVEWADAWVYLGITLKSGKTFSCSITEQVKKFYRCVNGIFRIEGRSNDTVMLRLVEAQLRSNSDLWDRNASRGRPRRAEAIESSLQLLISKNLWLQIV